MEESLAAVASGIDLHGICLFPAVDMPDWHTGQWLHNGICDPVEEGPDLKRVPDGDYVEELRRWQRELNRVTVFDEDPFSDPVELQDVIDAAERLQMCPTKTGADPTVRLPTHSFMTFLVPCECRSRWGRAA